MLVICLAVGSSLVYGVSDFLGGLKGRSMPLLALLLISQTSALLLVATIVTALGAGPPRDAFLLYAALAGVAEAGGITALYRGLAVGSMTVAPVAATAPMVPLVASIAIGELPGAVQSGGMLLAIAGVAMIAIRPPSPHPSRHVGSSLFYGVMTAAGFGGFLVAMDAASEGGVGWALLGARLTTVAVFGAAFLATRPRLPRRPTELGSLAGCGALIVGADAMYAIASTIGLLGVVAVLSSLYPIVTVTLANRYLGEHLEPLQLLGIVLVLGGATAVCIA